MIHPGSSHGLSISIWVEFRTMEWWSSFFLRGIAPLKGLISDESWWKQRFDSALFQVGELSQFFHVHPYPLSYPGEFVIYHIIHYQKNEHILSIIISIIHPYIHLTSDVFAGPPHQGHQDEWPSHPSPWLLARRLDHMRCLDAGAKWPLSRCE